MSGSKGGHSAKSGDRDERPFKSMFEFEEQTYDVWDVRRIERGSRPSTEFSTGLSFYLLIRFNSYPAEKYFDFATKELRDSKHRALKAKLLSHGVNWF